ncbi:MAG: DUF47 family protein, partial [Candidatus Bathyarchaeia archaeon]
DELGLLISLITGETGDSATCSLSVIKAKIEIISVHEAFADEAHLKSLVAMCEGALFSGLREDFIKLFESIDDIADYAKDSSQILDRNELNTFIRLLREESDAQFTLFFNKIVESVTALKKAIINLGRNAEESINMSIQVKELEEEADDIKWSLLKKLYSRKSEIDTLTLLELKEFVLTLDGISDASARSSEILIAIITKARA